MLIKYFLFIIFVSFFSLNSFAIDGIEWTDYEIISYNNEPHRVLPPVTVVGSRSTSYNNSIKVYFQAYAWYGGEVVAWGAVQPIWVEGVSHEGTFIFTKTWNGYNYICNVTVVEGSPRDDASFYFGVIDFDNPDSFPKDYKLVTEKRYIKNPFDFPIYIKVYYDNDLLDTVTIPSGTSHTFELETFSRGDSPDNFDFQISPDNNLYQPSPASTWNDLIRHMSKIFQDNSWGGIGGVDYEYYIPPVVTNLNDADIVNSDVVNEYQLALQRQDLSSQSLQMSFENALNKNVENDKQSIIDGIVFSGIPIELQNISSKFDNDLKFDDNALISAINNLSLNSDVTVDVDNDFTDLIAAIENISIMSTNYITSSTTNMNSISLTNIVNFPSNLFTEYDGFYFDYTNNLIDFDDFDDLLASVDDLTNAFSFFNEDKQSIIDDISQNWSFVPSVTLDIQKQSMISIPIGLIDSAFISFDMSISPIFSIIRSMFFLAMSYAFFVRYVKVILWGLN